MFLENQARPSPRTIGEQAVPTLHPNVSKLYKI
jgi:hypothetical protein